MRFLERLKCCSSSAVPESPDEFLHNMAYGCTNNAKAVLKLVKAGADVCYRPASEDRLPTFLLFGLTGRVDCFLACLATDRPIDFSRGFVRWTFYSPGDGREMTFSPSAMFYVCHGRSVHESVRMLKAVLQRLEKHSSRDVVNWENTLNSVPHKNFCSIAADNQLLHALWPLLQGLPHFAAQTEPIPIQTGICAEDWERIPQAAQKRFVLLNGFVDTNTSALFKVVLNQPPDLEAVKRCVAAGARIQQKTITSVAAVDVVLVNCNAECVAACMDTPHPIDFTLCDHGWSILDLICIYSHDESAAKSMLEPMVKRIAAKRPGDKVDWEQRDYFGHNFFGYATEYDLLHVVWPIVKQLPHFQRMERQICLDHCVTTEDWDQLHHEDQKRFYPKEGFVARQFRLRGDRIVFRAAKRIVERGREVKWEKVKEIGRGTYGVVYLGKLTNESLVAVKVANPFHPLSSLQEVNRVLVEEIDIMKHLRHKNIVTFYGATTLLQEDGTKQTQIFMEFCSGLYDCPGTLAEVVHKRPEMFTIQVVRDYTRQLLEGLQYLHLNSVVHRDLKPDNVLLTRDGVAKLTDFGCSKHLKGGASCRTLTGTPRFIAPEVLDPSQDSTYNEAADIWSLGCTILALLRRQPWREELNEMQLLWHIAFSKKMPSGIPRLCPPALKSFFECCFRLDPAKRWTAEKLLQHPWITCCDDELEEVPPSAPTSPVCRHAAPRW